MRFRGGQSIADAVRAIRPYIGDTGVVVVHYIVLVFRESRGDTSETMQRARVARVNIYIMQLKNVHSWSTKRQFAIRVARPRLSKRPNLKTDSRTPQIAPTRPDERCDIVFKYVRK